MSQKSSTELMLFVSNKLRLTKPLYLYVGWTDTYFSRSFLVMKSFSLAISLNSFIHSANKQVYFFSLSILDMIKQ